MIGLRSFAFRFMFTSKSPEVIAKVFYGLRSIASESTILCPKQNLARVWGKDPHKKYTESEETRFEGALHPEFIGISAVTFFPNYSFSAGILAWHFRV